MVETRREGPVRSRTDSTSIRVIVMPDARHQNARAVGTFPPEDERKFHFVLLRSHEDVVTIAGALENGGQARGVAEGVRVEADLDVNAEGALTI